MNEDGRERPRLPAERAFVVMLSADCRPLQEDVRGRVEHVRTGRTAHFQTLAELLAFLALLTTAGEPPG